MSHHSETYAGTIEGLYLPWLAWEMLHRESIGSLASSGLLLVSLSSSPALGPKRRMLSDENSTV